MTEHAADAERLVPAHYTWLLDAIENADLRLSLEAMIESDLAERDTALRDAEAALRAEVGRLREERNTWVQCFGEVYNAWLREQSGDPDTKSLRHPLTPVLRDWCEEHNRGSLPDGLCPECETRRTGRILETRPAASGLTKFNPAPDGAPPLLPTGVTRTITIGPRSSATASGEDAERVVKDILDLLPDDYRDNIGIQGAIECFITDAVNDAKAAARLSGRAETLKLDEPVIAAARLTNDALVAAMEELRLIRMKDTGSVYNPVLRTQAAVAQAAYDDALAVRDALKALPE